MKIGIARIGPFRTTICPCRRVVYILCLPSRGSRRAPEFLERPFHAEINVPEATYVVWTRITTSTICAITAS